MRTSLFACKQALPQPLMNFPGGISMEPFVTSRRRKDKVVIVMGATGTGKSRLSIDLATRFPAEIINSDKIQVYEGLDITTNKVTVEECRGVPHHLLGIIDPNTDFTAGDFCHHALLALESIIRRGNLPIIAGGSNSFIKSLVNDNLEFQSKYECCFLWVDVSLEILCEFVRERVNRMVEIGLVKEVREFYDPRGDYSQGIRRAIGVPEMDEFFRSEGVVDDETTAKILETAIDKIKVNTCKLACCQLQNILRLESQLKWNMHHLCATEAFEKGGGGGQAHEAWERLVAGPSTLIVQNFLCEDYLIAVPPSPGVISVATPVIGTTSAPAVAAVTH